MAPADADDDDGAVLARAQAVIVRVLDREADPNPRLLHTLATLCEHHDQRSQAIAIPCPSFSRHYIRMYKDNRIFNLTLPQICSVMRKQPSV
jgi:hypothetical protein